MPKLVRPYLLLRPETQAKFQQFIELARTAPASVPFGNKPPFQAGAGFTQVSAAYAFTPLLCPASAAAINRYPVLLDLIEWFARSFLAFATRTLTKS